MLQNLSDSKVFDPIILSNVLEYIEDRVKFLGKIFQNQKTSTVLLLRVPMINRDWITLYKKEKGIEWRLDKTHYIEYTLEQLQKELVQAGLYLENYVIKFGELYGIVKRIQK